MVEYATSNKQQATSNKQQNCQNLFSKIALTFALIGFLCPVFGMDSSASDAEIRIIEEFWTPEQLSDAGSYHTLSSNIGWIKRAKYFKDRPDVAPEELFRQFCQIVNNFTRQQRNVNNDEIYNVVEKLSRPSAVFITEVIIPLSNVPGSNQLLRGFSTLFESGDGRYRTSQEAWGYLMKQRIIDKLFTLPEISQEIAQAFNSFCDNLCFTNGSGYRDDPKMAGRLTTLQTLLDASMPQPIEQERRNTIANTAREITETNTNTAIHNVIKQQRLN